MSFLDRLTSMLRPKAVAKSQSVVPTTAATPSIRASDRHLEEVQVSRAIANGVTGCMCNSPILRQVLIDVAQKEDIKNCFFTGLLNRLAHDRVGSGIKLRVHTENETWNTAVQLQYERWRQAAGIVRKYRASVRDAGKTGELVGVKFTNQKIANPVKLDAKFVDCRRLTDGFNAIASYDKNHVDGIDFDDDDNPITYWIAEPDYRTANMQSFGMLNPPKPYPAENVIHWFVNLRPEQKRGIPETTPALMLYPQLRRYTEAVIRAAELSASIVFTLETNSAEMPAANADGAFSCYDVEPGMIQQMPEGWALRTSKAEQPTTNHSEFKKTIVAEAGLCVNMPYIIAAADASGSNFSSANVDWQPYVASTKIIRNDLAWTLEDSLFRSWYDEAILLEDYLPRRFRQRYGSAQEVPHTFGFDRLHRHVDPLKGSKAVEIALASGETTLTEIWEEKGEDVRVALQEEARLMGVTFEQLSQMIVSKRYSLDKDEMAQILLGESLADTTE